jgi:hypothetical protein
MRKPIALVIMSVVALLVGAMLVQRATETGDSNEAGAKEQSAVPVAQAVDRQEDFFRAKEVSLGSVSDPTVVQQSCGSDQRYVSVTFQWEPSGKGEQWTDISLFANDFAAGTFIGAGPFNSKVGQITWDGLMLGRTHYLRVNTLTSSGWESGKTLVFTTGTCVGGTVTDVYDPGLQALGQRFLDAIGSYWADGTYDACATDLQTAQTACANGVRQQLSGCVINFFVILQSVVDVQNNTRPESDVGDLISRTIYGSNASTAHELYGIVGGGDFVTGVSRVRDLIARLEMKSTIIDHPPAFDGESLGVDESNWITALDANNALAKIYHGEILTPFWRDYLLAKMEGVKPGLNYLIGSTPGGIVSHKNGFFAANGWVDNDIGIVRLGPNGEFAYAISFFSQDVPGKYDDIALGQEIMSTAWKYFSTKY